MRPSSVASDRRAATCVVRVDLVDGRLEVSGDLDGRTAHWLLDAVSALRLCPRSGWTVDLTDLGSCDGEGLRAIRAVYSRAAALHCPMTVVGGPRALRADLAAAG